MNREYSEIILVDLIGITFTDDPLFENDKDKLIDIKNKLYKNREGQ